MNLDFSEIASQLVQGFMQIRKFGLYMCMEFVQLLEQTVSVQNSFEIIVLNILDNKTFYNLAWIWSLGTEANSPTHSSCGSNDIYTTMLLDAYSVSVI